MEDKEEGVFFRMNRLSLLSLIDNNCNYLLKKRNEKMYERARYISDDL